MLIAICDDDIHMQESIKKICTDVLQRKNKFYKSEIKLFNSGKELIEYECKPDIIMLDIEMPEMNGISVKQRFQNLDKRTLIIFVTRYSEMISEAIGINVFGFVDKKMLQKQLPMIFEQAINMIDKDVVVMIDGEIRSDMIKYIRAEHIYSILVMEDGKEYSIRKTMRDLEKELLEAGFIRVHRKYIVNMHWIDKIDKKVIYIENKTIAIAVDSVKRVKEAYNDYCLQNARYC